jgi:hypothetical protein
VKCVSSWLCLLRNYVTTIHGQQNFKFKSVNSPHYGCVAERFAGSFTSAAYTGDWISVIVLVVPACRTPEVSTEYREIMADKGKPSCSGRDSRYWNFMYFKSYRYFHTGEPGPLPELWHCLVDLLYICCLEFMFRTVSCWWMLLTFYKIEYTLEKTGANWKISSPRT